MVCKMGRQVEAAWARMLIDLFVSFSSSRGRCLSAVGWERFV